MGWKSTWTEELVAELRDLWAKGPSAAVIAGKLKMTRNAVLGKVHRLKLDKRSNRNGTYYGPEREVVARNQPKRIPRKSVFRTPDIKPVFRPVNPGARPGLHVLTSPITGAYLNTKRRLPTQPEYTKDQLRAQLTQAIKNTAALA